MSDTTLLTDPNPSYTDSRLSSQQVVESIASVLEEMCAINDSARQSFPDLATVTRFHSICKAPITLCDYLTRIRQFSTCSNSCFIVGLMFLDRAQRHANLAVDSLSAHRLIVTAIMIASKAFDDRIQKNKAYSIIGGLSNEEMNRLEIELLNALDFDLEILPGDLLKYEEALLRRHARYCIASSTTPSLSMASTPSVTPSVASPASSISSGSFLSCSPDDQNVFFPVTERSVSSLSSSSAGSVSVVSSPDCSVLSSSLGSSAAGVTMHAFERPYSDMLVDPAI